MAALLIPLVWHLSLVAAQPLARQRASRAADALATLALALAVLVALIVSVGAEYQLSQRLQLIDPFGALIELAVVAAATAAVWGCPAGLCRPRVGPRGARAPSLDP